MQVNTNVGFTVVETPTGHIVKFENMSRPATNEEIILWSALQTNEDERRKKFDSMLDSFDAVMSTDSERISEAFNTCRGPAIFALTIEVSRYKKQLASNQSKLTAALEYIQYVGSVVGALKLDELQDDEDPEKKYRVLNDESVAILQDIAAQSKVTQEELDFPLHQQLSGLRNKVGIAVRMAKYIRELADADCAALLTEIEE